MIIVNLTGWERQTLFATRNQKRKLDRMRARVALSPIYGGYRSPQITGMPMGGSVPCGLDGSTQGNEAELTELERVEEEYEELRGQAIRIANQMDERLAEFAHHYFVDGKDIKDTAKLMGKDVTTCWDYLARINGKYQRRGKTRTTMYDNVR